jgi:hypothetical protein
MRGSWSKRKTKKLIKKERLKTELGGRNTE